MLHSHRTWTVKDCPSAETLADDLTRTTWTLCQGFRYGDTLWLNDSTSPDALQEYAAVRTSDGLQVESITVSWCDAAKMLDYIRAIAAGEQVFPCGYIDLARIETPAQHGRCPHCA